jgi:hypothetical protein
VGHVACIGVMRNAYGGISDRRRLLREHVHGWDDIKIYLKEVE